MRLLFQGTVPKVLEYPGDNEDAAAIDEARGRIAMSDGASESYDSKTWSNLLVRRFVRDPRVGPAWVRRAVQEFAGRVNRDELSWSKQASFDRGSFATLLGIHWDPSKAVVDCWCIGDSLVALLDGSDLVECLPYTDAADFQRRPQLLSTNHSLNAFVSKGDFRRRLHHQWRVEHLHAPVLVCITDGIAEWALRESVSRPEVWGQLAGVGTGDELTELVRSERAAHNMRVDDVTLVTVGLDLRTQGMTYPSLEQYNEALQHPQLALLDPAFKTASVAKSGLGLPLALCGGFALTYTVTAGGRKYAVRCFHKQSNALEARYSAIDAQLKSLKSPYFLDFEFQPHGVRVGKGTYPVVKMAWASGTTLGEFLAANYRDAVALDRLDTAMSGLAAFLEDRGIAHGDVQPGNVMVAPDAGSVQLIDYDGMYVPALQAVGSAELGLRNFQHPKRTAATWNTSLDRFSFATVALALRALKADPALWKKYQADENSLLFKANDFASPQQSEVLKELRTKPGLERLTNDFASICAADYAATPTLADYLAGRNVPKAPALVAGAPAAAGRYLSAFPVLPSDFGRCLRSVGDRIELIGRITDVKRATSRYGQPYVFINFGDWRDDIVKINIWSDGLAALTTAPDATWIGKWISVTGLLEPIYRGKQGYRHLSVTVTQSNQMHIITAKEATYRLAGSSTRSAAVDAGRDNQAILDAIHGGSKSAGTSPRRPKTPTPAKAKTANELLLEQMKAAQGASSKGRPGVTSQPSYAPKTAPRGGVGSASSGTRPPGPDRHPARSLSGIQIAGLTFAALLIGWLIYVNMSPG